MILLGLAALRLALRGYVGQVLSAQQTAGLFFVVAFGMIVRWRRLHPNPARSYAQARVMRPITGCTRLQLAQRRRAKRGLEDYRRRVLAHAVEVEAMRPKVD